MHVTRGMLPLAERTTSQRDRARGLGWRPFIDKGKPGPKRLPASWTGAVEYGLPLPSWARQPAAWMLSAPRWVYVTLGSAIFLSVLSLAIALFTVYSYISRTVPIPTPMLGSATQTGHVYAIDGSLLADLHGSVNRQSVTLDRIATPLKQAVIAAEDGSFYSHHALDFRSLIRAGASDLAAGHWVQGGSSITQQYVKLVYVGSQRTLGRKMQEARLAYQIERRLSKDEILNRYLNTVYFGRGAYGVQAAALTYFNKPASDLDVGESTLLAGMLASPTAYSPDTRLAASEQRRSYVVHRLEALGFITAPAAEQALLAPPKLSPPPVPTAIAYRYPWFVDTVRKYLFQKYGEAMVLGGGLDVQTTLDPAAQDKAEAAVAKALPSASDPYAGLVSIHPKTGYVTTMVAGRDFGTEKFNLATQGRRQPGSAMKPFVLIAALQKGISPLNVYQGPAKICLANWLPTCDVSTFQNESFGSITLETATIHSVNTVYAQLIMQIGPESVVKVANAMGVPGPRWLLPSVGGCQPAGSTACVAHLLPVPSLALGSNDVSPLEMASAYATLADHGVYHEPKFVSKVTDLHGRVLEEGPSDGQQAVDPTIVRTVNKILNEVVTMGTGTAANIDRPEAGKTGTTSDYRNAWFVGYTPELATSVWVGYRDSNRPLLGVEGVPQMAGGTIPAQVWATFMKSALAGADRSTLAADAQDMGLSPGAVSTVGSGPSGSTWGSAFTPSGVPGSCILLPSTTVVAPLPSPVTGTAYNVYPYLVCGARRYWSPAPTPTPSQTDLPPISPGDSSSSPVATQPSDVATPVPGPTRAACVIGLLC